MTKTLEYLYPKHPFLEQIHNHLKFSAEVTDSLIREFKQTKHLITVLFFFYCWSSWFSALAVLHNMIYNLYIITIGPRKLWYLQCGQYLQFLCFTPETPNHLRWLFGGFPLYLSVELVFLVTGQRQLNQNFYFSLYWKSIFSLNIFYDYPNLYHFYKFKF